MDIREKGYLPLDAVRETVNSEVTIEKKAVVLLDKMNATNATTLDALSGKLNLKIADAENVTMTNPYIPGIGNEPTVVGTVFASKTGQLSKPIKGFSGITVFTVKSFKEATPAKDYSSIISTTLDQRKSRSDYEVFNALKEKANIEDNRGKFY